ncbi:MAG: hypothetical protein INF43_04810 [Alphaproteobacteria bacterium]|nr:hypothetical protein [Alphaproteobacteria bacterium]
MRTPIIETEEKVYIVGGLVLAVLGVFLLEGNDLAFRQGVSLSAFKEALGYTMAGLGTLIATWTGWGVINRPY